MRERRRGPLRHILVGALFGLVAGMAYEVTGGPYPGSVAFGLALVGMYGSAWLADRRRTR